MAPALSIVIPVHNESGSLPGLLDGLESALASVEHEVILVNDGSTDGSADLLDQRARRSPNVRVIHLTRNFGQTAALSAGLEAARGEIVATMDADGQNDPADIGPLAEAVRAGADVACGRRASRQDVWLTRRLPSAIANAVIRYVTGVRLHDYGCTLKAFRRSVVTDLRLYGEMHRLIPIWCAWRGASIVEIDVRHHPRRTGRSHYGLGRTFRVFLDLLTAKFFYSYLANPSHALGGLGIVLLCGSFLAGLFPILDKFYFNHWGPQRVPFIIFSVFLGLLGMQFIALGILAEILIRIYYESRGGRPYRVARTVPAESAPL